MRKFAAVTDKKQVTVGLSFVVLLAVTKNYVFGVRFAAAFVCHLPLEVSTHKDTIVSTIMYTFASPPWLLSK